MSGSKWSKMFFRNTLVAHKSLINPYFMRFEVFKEIIISTREYFSIFIPEVIRLLVLSISLHFVDFSNITNQIIKKPESIRIPRQL